MQKSLFALSFVAVAAAASGATFSAGGGQGTSIVDANGTGDYTTLRAAADDFSTYAGGCTGNWTLLIRSDLSETSSSVFGNETNGHTVTIKPATGVSPTVTFGYYPKPAGTWWDGGLIFGPRSQTAGTDMANIDGFVVDGSNTAGGTTRDLKFVNTLPPEGQTELSSRIMLRVVGQCDNFVIKNCVIESVAPGVSDNIAIDILSRDSFVPSNGRIENCEIKAAVGKVGIGVRCANTGTVPTGSAQVGMTVTKCDITAALRDVFFNVNAGGTISYNTLSTSQTVPNRQQVVFHAGSHGTTGWNLDIIGNRFTDMRTIDIGGWLFLIGCNAPGTYNIINNTISGLEYDYTGTNSIASTNWLVRGISVEGGGRTAIYNILHNSINMGHIAKFATADDTSSRLGVISLLSAGAFSGTLNIQNNIFRYEQSNGTILSLDPAGTANVISSSAVLNINNNTYHAAGIVGKLGTTVSPGYTQYTTLADWKGAGHDAASNAADPTVAASAGAGKWVSATDLHFDADPGSTYAGVAGLGVSTDIDQQTRSTTAPTKGADEYVATSGVSEWMMFE